MGRPVGTGARSHSSSGTQQEEEGGERGREQRNEREREGERHQEAYQCGVFKRGEGVGSQTSRGGVELLFLDSFEAD